MKYFSLFFLILTCVLQSKAFTLNSSTNSNLQGWAGADVQLMVNTFNCPADIDVVGIINEAVEVWNNVPTSSIKVTYGGETSASGYGSPPIVYCETNFQALLGADQDYVPGAASVHAPSGQITSGVLYLNVSSGQAHIRNFDRTTLTIVLAHEIGHILGLGHSDDINALMYFDASAKTTLSLAQDDIDGMSYLYPSDELKDSKLMGCGVITSLFPPSGAGLALTFMFWILPLVVLTVSKKFQKPQIG